MDRVYIRMDLMGMVKKLLSRRLSRVSSLPGWKAPLGRFGTSGLQFPPLSDFWVPPPGQHTKIRWPYRRVAGDFPWKMFYLWKECPFFLPFRF